MKRQRKIERNTGAYTRAIYIYFFNLGRLTLVKFASAYMVFSVVGRGPGCSF